MKYYGGTKKLYTHYLDYISFLYLFYKFNIRRDVILTIKNNTFWIGVLKGGTTDPVKLYIPEFIER